MAKTEQVPEDIKKAVGALESQAKELAAATAERTSRPIGEAAEQQAPVGPRMHPQQQGMLQVGKDKAGQVVGAVKETGKRAGETVAGAATGVAHAASGGASAFSGMAQEGFAATKDMAFHVACATAGAAGTVAGVAQKGCVAVKDMAQHMVGTTPEAGTTVPEAAGAPAAPVKAAADAKKAV